MREGLPIPGNSPADARGTANRVLGELIRSQNACAPAEACRRLAASETTLEEKRLLVRELLRSAAERP